MRLFPALPVICLLVAAVLVAACVRGHHTADWLQWQQTNPSANTWRAIDVVIGTSGIYVSWQQFWFERPGKALEYARNLGRVSGFSHITSEPQGNPYSDGSLGEVSLWNRVGFGYRLKHVTDPGSADGPYSSDFDHAHVPYWALILCCLAAASWLSFVHYRRFRWAGELQCVHCGYDLRATPDRCPECGKRVEPR